MSSAALALLLAIHAAALVSPGPDFAIVTRLSIVQGRRSGLWAAAGVTTGIGIYVLICLLGLSLVIAALPWLSQALSIAGALYLAWLGIQCLRSKGDLPQAHARGPASKAFATGLLTNLLSPKAMLYFGSILSQALTPALGAADAALLWCLLVSESFLWFGFVAVLFSSRRILEWVRGHLKWFDRIVGAVLLAMAGKLASLASQ